MPKTDNAADIAVRACSEVREHRTGHSIKGWMALVWLEKDGVPGLKKSLGTLFRSEGEAREAVEAWRQGLLRNLVA